MRTTSCHRFTVLGNGMQQFRGPRGGDDPLGSAKNSQAHRINIAMTESPQTVAALV